MPEWTSENEENYIREAVEKFYTEQEDPHFLVLGATGAGKSSLLNRVFGKVLHKVGNVESTTRNFGTSKFADASGKDTIILTDSPGYGEVGHDEEYSSQVVKVSRDAHVIILVLKADEKGYQRDLDILGNVFKAPEFSKEQPLIIVLNQIDKLAPTREWSPPYDLSAQVSPSDPDKVRNMKEKISLVRQQFKSVTGSAPIVCATMAEPNDGEVFGIQELREQLYESLPEVAKLKYSRASNVAAEASKEFLSKLNSHANTVIGLAATAAASAVLLNPVPASDWVALVPIQLGMVVKLGAVYGKPIDSAYAKETLLALGAGFAARSVFQGMISLLPGLKNLIGPPYAAAATHGMGVAAKMYFISGKVPAEDVIKNIVNLEYERQIAA
jgi:small GTP-binding protein